ncbi:preprotein translocase subunit SecE [Furfurilactobacillus siliginis]|uniref:Protein translocase subunit SecE n=1 Tax=Furfurilactobacillus siliginis TaxID=348151 RepID=A0A510VQZ1_9LACO|nr:preprotein translocase subunit SecE [Furfurilactobacillus siliginis]GEK29367.1 protein translocase subunit SecE [Furfurilactobacillus siliginis]
MRFIKSVFSEMKLVRWPSAAENRRDSSIVIFVSVAFAAFFALIDWGVQALITWLA